MVEIIVMPTSRLIEFLAAETLSLQRDGYKPVISYFNATAVRNAVRCNDEARDMCDRSYYADAAVMRGIIFG